MAINQLLNNKTISDANTGTGTVRPGDDLLFRIGVVYYPEFNATVPAGDFMVVYDKKLVWRAQLYIDEGAKFLIN